MRIFCDTASLAEIEQWAEHPWVSGFTTNPTLMRQAGATGMEWAREAVAAAQGKPISIDGPPEVLDLGENVWRKIIESQGKWGRHNITAICHVSQVPTEVLGYTNIISVFAGRILDTGRDPQPVIDRAKATGAQVLWASVREPYHMVMAERAGCDIITVPPPILRKWLDWHGKPLEVVAEETIAQFERDAEGLW